MLLQKHAQIQSRGRDFEDPKQEAMWEVQQRRFPLQGSGQGLLKLIQGCLPWTLVGVSVTELLETSEVWFSLRCWLSTH